MHTLRREPRAVRLPRPHPAAVAAISAAALAALLLPAGLPATGADQGPRPFTPSDTAGPGERTVRTVTLITGDQVTVVPGAQDKPEALIAPGPGREHIAMIREVTQGKDGKPHLSVIPADAVRLLAAGKLDRRLFDVTAQAETWSDAHHGAKAGGPGVAAILTYRGKPPAQPPGAADGVRQTHRFTGINSASVEIKAQRAGELWDAVTRRYGSVRTLAPGLAKVCLLYKIGAPAAWEAGYTGKGVKIAVLDSGIDANHPDFAKKILDSRDFSDSPDGVEDTVGHGTHVASIAAGSGAASAGKFRGVAPDADLLIGRVCGTSYCDDSAVLAGMEWAAQSGADIVNLSLGQDGGDGTDPMELAVDRLSEKYGTLFVAAVGNSFCRPGTAASPATAAAALAVGSVDPSDNPSWFTSCGPRRGDGGVKPDLGAPGEDIAAARAAGTTMGEVVDEHYVRSSGTSMATPHVAGAAALLKQRHRDWTGAQLKAALVSAADPHTDASVFHTGTGRLDVPRALNQSVYAETSGVGFGLLRYPQRELPAVHRTVTYCNTGDSAVDLDLSASLATGDGTPLPDGALTLSVDRLTVPAGGTAQVRLTLDPAKLDDSAVGELSGRLKAYAGTSRVVTALGAVVEPESYDVTVKGIDRDGKSVSDELPQYLGVFTQNSRYMSDVSPEFKNGRATFRIPVGTYSINSILVTPDPAQPAELQPGTMAIRPDTVVDRDRTITLDARAGKPVTATASDRPRAQRQYGELAALMRNDEADHSLSLNFGSIGGAPMYAVPVRTKASTLVFGHNAVLISPDDAPDPRTYYLAYPPTGGGIPQRLTFSSKDSELGTDRARYRAQGMKATGGRGEAPWYLPDQVFGVAVLHDIPLPGNRTELFTPGPGDGTKGAEWSDYLFPRPSGTPYGLPDGIILGERARKAGDTFRQDWNAPVIGPDMDLHLWNNGVVRFGNAIQTLIGPFSPNEPNHGSPAIVQSQFSRGTMVLSKDGKEIGRGPVPGLGFFGGLPPEKGRYTLTMDAHRTVAWSQLAPRVTTEWSWESEEAPLANQPLLNATVSGDFDELGRAPAFSWFSLQVTAAAQKGAPAATLDDLSVEISFDDGETWERAWIQERHGNTAKVAVFNHALGSGTDFASLRVKASDTAGGTVEQTVIRAYGLE